MQFCLPKHQFLKKKSKYVPTHEAGFPFSAPTRVGAILRFFFSWPLSSLSLSLASRFTPLTELFVLLGVCGGVVIGTPETSPSPTLPAEIPGIVPPTRGGLLIIVPAAGVAYDACVAIEEVEFDRVGEEGRTVGPRGAGGGEGATLEKLEEVRWWLLLGKGDGGAITEVGVCIGVFCDEETAVLLIVGCFAVGTSPV